MLGDVINGLFEFCGALATLSSVRAIIKDKCWAGLSPFNIIFFQAWGVFNIFYYPSLDQWWSFTGGCAIVVGNTIYLICILKYPHRPMSSV